MSSRNIIKGKMITFDLFRAKHNIIIVAFCSVAYAASDVYVYKDKNGHTVVSNINKNGFKITLPPLAVYAVPMSKSDVIANGYTEQLPFTTKKPLMSSINNDELYFTSKQNTTRREILQDELNKEDAALADSTNLLKMSKSIKSQNENTSVYQERIKALEDSVTEHEKNIEILKKEIN